MHQRKKQRKGRCKNTPFLNKDPTNLWSPPKAASAYVYLNPHREIVKEDVFIFFYFSLLNLLRESNGKFVTNQVALTVLYDYLLNTYKYV